ncbi:hypothetical protein [Pseudogemmobacter faecipullorum]|uniref:Uncharacterized protein n=1 Tax=Pseudogemmobacter faecipullorum TaxID=2755041 RepID=A0ABS8CHN9_9RHOB|nr:hypothetical protein [Pseudogemmobacter faecipullorum]MCB5408660.1 hypothetical protein [Pseudogemmobacter faecipullorum]
MHSRLPALALAGSLILSLANIIAGAFGLRPALVSLTGLELPGLLLTPLALLAAAALILSWVNSLMSNRAGMGLYLGNALLAPFGYAQAGLPWPLGLALALAPIPFYRGISLLAGRGE